MRPDATITPDWPHAAPVPKDIDVLRAITYRRESRRAHVFGTWPLQAPALHPSMSDISLAFFSSQHRLLFPHLATITRRSQ